MENPLVGKTLLAVLIADDRQAIKFVTDAGDVIANCDGDCCSYTWIEGLEIPSLPAKVLAVDDLSMPEGGPSVVVSDPECVAYYGLKVTTERGDLVLDYRNNSNGYYGGNLSWPGEYFYGGVHGQNVSKHNWVTP